MSKKILIIGLIIIAGGFLIFSGKDDTSSNNDAAEDNDAVSAVPAPTQEQRVVIGGHKIQEGKITIPVGTTVIFENKDSFQGLPYTQHTVTTGDVDETGVAGVAGVVPNSGSGEPDGVISAPLGQNDTFSYTFTEAGTFTFYVSEHPLVSGQGEITVNVVEEAVVDTEVIKMESVSFAFSPVSLKANVGEPVTIDITSTGEHTFTIDELGVDVTTPHGQTTRVEFTPEEAGTYEYYCAIPGHKEAGQIGTLVVE